MSEKIEKGDVVYVEYKPSRHIYGNMVDINETLQIVQGVFADIVYLSNTEFVCGVEDVTLISKGDFA